MTNLTKLTLGLTAVVLAVAIWVAGSLWALWVGAVEAAGWWLEVVAG